MYESEEEGSRGAQRMGRAISSFYQARKPTTEFFPIEPKLSHRILNTM